jgi:hypothetical protein
MRKRNWLWLGATVAVVSLGCGNLGRAQDPDTQTGVDVQTRGPVHEAFMVPVQGEPAPNPITPKQPPDPIPEQPPDQKPDGDNVQWIPGYWAWDDDTADYLWISGAWRNVPPGKRWVPGHWGQVTNGWQWVSGFWADAAQEQVNYLPPPPASIDIGPSTPAPDANSIFVPGCWVYVNARYNWRPGFWHACRPDWIWIPAHYAWTPVGCVFIEGFWDYELPRRGLLFAPVRIAAAILRTAGWRYRPSFVVSVALMTDALFVRPSFGCYYFGDYFAPGYDHHGFIPWMDYHVGKFAIDPLFAHYRWEHREVQHWEYDYRHVYAERRAGTAPRPPRTLVQQEEYLRKINNEKIVPGTKPFTVTDVHAAVHNATVVTHVTKIDPAVVKVHSVPKEQITEHNKSAEELRALSVERSHTEAKILTEKPPPSHPSDPVPGTKFVLPKTTVTTRTTTVQVPAHPTLPTHIERPLPPHTPPQPIRVPNTPHNLETGPHPPPK